jgi:endoribonuclease Dicer
MLGDSFLKLAMGEHLFLAMPLAAEGPLTAARGRLVSNQHLCAVGIDCGLSVYLRALPFCAGGVERICYLPPGMDVDESIAMTSTSPSRQYAHATVKYKTVADLVEAVIGACLLSGGVAGGLRVMQRLGLLPRDGRNVSVRELGGSEETHNYEVVSPQVISELESLLHYSFHSLSLLLGALTHNGRVNERLEFLGDAVLDFIVVDILFREQPELSQGGLTVSKSRATSNRNLSKFALKHGLFRYLQVDTTVVLPSDEKMTTLVTTCVPVNMLENAVSDLLSDSMIKILGDFCEALIGAVYVDSGGDLRILEGVVREIMELGGVGGGERLMV